MALTTAGPALQHARLLAIDPADDPLFQRDREEALRCASGQLGGGGGKSMVDAILSSAVVLWTLLLARR